MGANLCCCVTLLFVIGSISFSSYTFYSMDSVVPTKNRLIIGLVAVATLILFLFHSIRYSPISVALTEQVNGPFSIAVAETPYLYWILHAFILIPIVALSFDRRVAFYKSWKYLLPAIALVGIIFILWDFVFTDFGVWGFSHDYTLDARVLKLPLEEWMFFLSAPFACMFIYECLRYYFPKDTFASFDKPLSIGMAALLILIGILTWGRLYTSFTCLAAGILILLNYYTVTNTYRTFFYKTQLVSFIPFILINGVLTGSITKAPVVMYNSSEILDLRFITIPVEDFVYCFVMLFAVVIVYEFYRGDPSKQGNIDLSD